MATNVRGRSMPVAGKNVFNFTPSPRRATSPTNRPPWRPAGQPQKRWMTPPNHTSPSPPRRRSPSPTPSRPQSALPRSGSHAVVVFTIRSIFEKSVTREKVQDFVLGHLSMAGQVPMEAFYITKYQNRAGEIVMSMEIRPTNAGSSTEMVRRLATALEDPKSKLHRPGSLSSKVFTAARMDVRNPGEVQREWASPVSSRAYSPTGNIGSPGKSGSSPTMARSLSPERVVAQARPIGVMKAAVTASQKILSRPVVKVEEEPVSEVAVRGRPAVVSRKVVRESTRKAKSGRGPAAPTESKRKGSEEVVSVSRNSTIKPMRKVSDAVLKVMEPLERKKDTGAKQESAFMAKWRETILNATKKSEPAGSYVVSVLPGQPGVPTRELERHTSQDMSSSLLEARRGLKLDGEAPESPGSLSAASAARNLETEGDAQVVSLDRALWDPLLHGKKARFDGYVLRSVELSGDGAQSWAVSEVKPYVDGDRLVWKCEIAGLLPADKLADAAETMGPGFGVCGRTTREVNAAIDTPEAAIVGYDLVSVAVAGRWVGPDKVFKKDWARELKIEDSVTVVVERTTGVLSIYVNGHEALRQELGSKMPKSPRLVLDVLGRVGAIRVLSTEEVGEVLAAWPLVRGSRRASMVSESHKGEVNTSKVSTSVGVGRRLSSQRVSKVVEEPPIIMIRKATMSSVSRSSLPETQSGSRGSVSRYTYDSSTSRTNTAMGTYSEQSYTAGSATVSSGGDASRRSSRTGSKVSSGSYSSPTRRSVTYSGGSYSSRQSYGRGSVTVASSASISHSSSVSVTDSSGYSSRSASVSVTSSGGSRSRSPSVLVTSSESERVPTLSVTSSYVTSYS